MNLTADFPLDGTGTTTAWAAADWLPVRPVDGEPGHATRAKLLYSAAGLY